MITIFLIWLMLTSATVLLIDELYPDMFWIEDPIPEAHGCEEVCE